MPRFRFALAIATRSDPEDELVAAPGEAEMVERIVRAMVGANLLTTSGA